MCMGVCGRHYSRVDVSVPEEAEPPGARGGGSEAGAEAALQQEARHQGRVQGHPAPRRAQGTCPHIALAALRN